MQVEAYSVLPDSYAHETDIVGLANLSADEKEKMLDVFGDVVTISDEAVSAFEESAFSSFKNGSFSLKQMDSRIAAVRAEIAQVWNSALPEDEKYRQINSKENEIALLQAGQFTFYRAGFSGVV